MTTAAPVARDLPSAPARVIEKGPTPLASRLSGVDNLRVGLTALVVAHHALQPYAFNQNWWIVERVPPVQPLGLLLWIDASFFMGLFFLISALFTPASVDRKGVGPFLGDRFRRLGIPLLLAFFVLLPPVGYYSHLSNRHAPWLPYGEYFTRLWLGIGGRPADWPEPHFPDGHFGHLWFVQHLLVYAVLYAAWRAIRPRATDTHASPPGGIAIASYAVVLGVVTWVVRLWYPMNAWTGLLGFIQSEPAHLPQYASLFVIGLIAGRHGWFASFPADTGNRWLRIGVAATLVACARAAIKNTIDVNSLTDSMIEAFICTGLSIGLLVACRDRWNRRTWVTAFGPDTYAVYVFHYLIVIALQYLLLSAPFGSLAKAAIVVPSGIVLAFAAGRVVRRLPGATAIF